MSNQYKFEFSTADNFDLSSTLKPDDLGKNFQEPHLNFLADEFEKTLNKINERLDFLERIAKPTVYRRLMESKSINYSSDPVQTITNFECKEDERKIIYSFLSDAIHNGTGTIQTEDLQNWARVMASKEPEKQFYRWTHDNVNYNIEFTKQQFLDIANGKLAITDLILGKTTVTNNGRSLNN